MSNKGKVVCMIAGAIFSISASKAQWAYITIDPDGYTNVREQPNASSKIVGKVYQYEVFFSVDDYCGNDMYATENWMPIDKWEPIDGKNVSGYMYSKYMFDIEGLPKLTIKKDIKDEEGSGSILCFNDSLSVTMKIQKFEKWHSMDERLGLKGMLHDPDVIKYMESNGLSDTKIEEIAIVNHRQKVKTVLPSDQIKKYCNPQTMEIYLGRSGELYVYIGGGDGESSYGAWLTIVNGEIIYQTPHIEC
jgi:hypothetical protein